LRGNVLSRGGRFLFAAYRDRRHSVRGIDWEQRRVDIGQRVAFDLFADAVQGQVERDQPEMRVRDFPDPARIEEKRVFARQPGAALAAERASGRASLRRAAAAGHADHKNASIIIP
jgi:hypothetical protein